MLWTVIVHHKIKVCGIRKIFFDSFLFVFSDHIHTLVPLNGLLYFRLHSFKPWLILIPLSYLSFFHIFTIAISPAGLTHIFFFIISFLLIQMGGGCLSHNAVRQKYTFLWHCWVLVLSLPSTLECRYSRYQCVCWVGCWIFSIRLLQSCIMDRA